jgi:glycine/D-amino acid oxidase-like deaminating enzyme
MTRSDASLWLLRAKRSLPPARPRLRGEVRADVAVVGGGITGCVAAYLIARGGLEVALVEAGRVGHGGTAAGPGRAAPRPGARFSALREQYGLRTARQVWEASRLAALDLASLLRRLRVLCDLETTDAVDVAVSAMQAEVLESEYRALKDAGFDVAWLPAQSIRQGVGLGADAAMKVAGGATLDPLRACLGVARHAERAGARVFEQSTAARLRSHRDGVEVVTDGGVVRAGIVVIATDAPGPEFEALRRHVRETDRYVVGLPPMGARARRAFGGLRAVARDLADPAHEWHWTKDGRLLFSGGDRAALPPKQREAARVQRGSQLMYELSLLHPHISGLLPDSCWTWRSVRSADGVILAGPHRHYPRHVFALATGEGGLGAAALAARIAARRVLGIPEKSDDVFGFGR